MVGGGAGVLARRVRLYRNAPGSPELDQLCAEIWSERAALAQGVSGDGVPGRPCTGGAGGVGCVLVWLGLLALLPGGTV